MVHIRHLRHSAFDRVRDDAGKLSSFLQRQANRLAITTAAVFAQLVVPGSSAAVVHAASVNFAPANTVAPTITGTAQTTHVLTAVNGTWTGHPAPTFTYQWNRAGVAISDGTGAASTYTVVTADIAKLLTVTVTGTNLEGHAAATAVGVTPAS